MSGHHHGCARSKEYLPVPELPVILVADVAHVGQHEEEKLTGFVVVEPQSFLPSFVGWFVLTIATQHESGRIGTFYE
eukprot:scaffold139767_cov57-Cyclotella_meneghiniana.AAC.1